MKRGKEIKLDLIDNLNVVFGTVDNKNPKSVYINISGWGEPCDKDEIDYGLIIKDIHKELKQLVFKSGNGNFFDLDKTIIDFDMRESGINYGKRSYMACEINLFQNGDFNLSSDELYNGLVDILNIVTKNYLSQHDYFKFYKTKM